MKLLREVKRDLVVAFILALLLYFSLGQALPYIVVVVATFLSVVDALAYSRFVRVLLRNNYKIRFLRIMGEKYLVEVWVYPLVANPLAIAIGFSSFYERKMLLLMAFLFSIGLLFSVECLRLFMRIRKLEGT